METIKELNFEERPYEKCERFGAANLTNTELLAILLRTGTKGESSLALARKILAPSSDNEGLLNIHNWSLEQLMSIKGIGKVKAIQILCIVELAKRLAKEEAGKQLCFNKPSTIARYYMEDLRHRKQEYMKLLLLNTKSGLIGETDISKGTVNTAIISPRELFIEALQKNAVFIILLHNHPSGDPSPSQEDICITNQIREAGALIGIELLDHIIIGDNCYISLKEQGYFR
ncbi:MAG: DNA repair protein RadC [Ruminococcus sp.]|nr:DNA repair protein RadC [Ruminococcus sp.]